MRKSIIIATRKSELAIWQANFVAKKLSEIHPGIEIRIDGIVTEGDIRLEKKLIDFGGKGAFIKELEVKLLNNEADIAVHSMKDFPPEHDDNLEISAIMERGNPFDAFISNKYNSFEELPKKAVIGTSSLRREYQILNLNKYLEIKLLRGNVNTRLKKLDDGEFDAILLANAGLKRLGLDYRIKQTLDIVPAIGQGALGIECKRDNKEIIELVKPLEHQLTKDCVLAERALGRCLGGNCQTPIGGFATVKNGKILLKAMLGDESDKSVVFKEYESDYLENKTEEVGKELARRIKNG